MATAVALVEVAHGATPHPRGPSLNRPHRVEMSSRGERLLIVGDLILHPLHVVHPEWHSVVDAEPALLRETRLAFFSRAAAAECVVWACHLPFPGLGRIRATGSGHAWDSSSFAPDEPPACRGLMGLPIGPEWHCAGSRVLDEEPRPEASGPWGGRSEAARCRSAG
jgi:hypothetical protein